MGIMALWVMLYGSRAGKLLEQNLGIHTQTPFLWRIIQWPVTSMLLLFSFFAVSVRAELEGPAMAVERSRRVRCARVMGRLHTTASAL